MRRARLHSSRAASRRAWWCALALPLLLVGLRCPAPGQVYFVSVDTGVRSARPIHQLDALLTQFAVAGIVEGDLFRVLSPTLLLDLNAYRGLQVIDVGDLSRPRIVGRLPLAGVPIEMYVLGDVAFVLLRGSPQSPASYPPVVKPLSEASRVVAVDLRDPARPAVLDEVDLPGGIVTSRLARAGERAALYVVASDWIVSDGSSHAVTSVASFDVSSGALVPVDRFELDGALVAAQATPEMLMVARHDWIEVGSRVTLIDIRDPGGVLVPGDEVIAAGRVQSRFNLDFHRGVLRIVSNDGVANHLQTFAAFDASDAVPVDAVEFGAGESLFATLFLGDRAFAVTYLRIDPFHAFAIDDDGRITPGAEFEVSGWNDFFRPVFDDSRLVGIGTDDQDGRTLAVSLYDVRDIANPTPLVARERVSLDGAGSEASFDHRAFSVLEDAVSVSAPGGSVETGLVLLPFNGWDALAQQAVSGVQIFSFSDHTLTRRGAMGHDSPVRRSFGAGEEVVANLSEETLAFFDTSDLDQPAALGALALAPNYTDVLRFGDHRARIVGAEPGARVSAVEIVAASADPDVAEAVARFDLAAGAVVHQVGSLLVGIAVDPATWTSGANPTSEITVYDLSDPTRPRVAGVLRSDRLQPAQSYWYGGFPIAIRCFDCGWDRTWGAIEPAAVPGGLVFLEGGWDRAWTLEVLDLRDPRAPRFAESVPLGAGMEGLGLVADGSDVWVAAKQQVPSQLATGTARFFALRVDASVPATPVADPAINVPGKLLAVDGARIYTLDQQWSPGGFETALVRLVLEPPLARVEAVRWFSSEREVDEVAFDGAGRVVVLHRPRLWLLGPIYHSDVLDVPLPASATLSVLDAGSDDLAVLSEIELADWASLLDAIPGHALLAVAGGLLVVDLDDAAPRFLPSRAPMQRIRVEGHLVIHAGGRYGIELFDLSPAGSRREPRRL